jgi:signal peptidase I
VTRGIAIGLGVLLAGIVVVFVLGDNRQDSLDSRYIGFVPIGNVTNVPTEIYFSWDPDSRLVRWNRIGLTVQ